VNTALLVLRLVPGLLLIGHGLQKLVPAKYSPPLLHAVGPRAAAGFFEQLGLRPALLSVVVASLGEIGGGFLIASGLVTPLGTALAAAVMTTAILSVHIGKGIWNAEGGIEFPLVILTMAYLASALGPGSLSIDSWAGIANWTGIHWVADDAVRAGASVGVGAAAGLLTSASARARKTWAQRQATPAAH
jgi:putative oxidoreductase